MTFALRPPAALGQIREKARYFAFGSVFYNWSLGGTPPAGLAPLPTDSWPADAARGRAFCETFALPESEWPMALQDFDILRDLRALGGDEARRTARQLIDSWLRRHRSWSADAWAPGLTGKRIANWLALHSFYSAALDEDSQDQLFSSIARQARHLSRCLPSEPSGLPLLCAIHGLAFAGLAFPGRENWLVQALDALQKETGRQILPDGGHASRSPAQLLQALRTVTDIRAGLAAGGYPVPEHLEHTIDRMAQAVRFFRYPDKGFAVFNGAQEGDAALIDAALARVPVQGRILRHLPNTGYERVCLGRSLLMIDAGTSPPRPYDASAHAAPLAFEFVYGKERLLVSCGSHPSDLAWRDALRGTPAHNTLTFDHRGAVDIGPGGHVTRRPNVEVTREENAGAVLIDSKHDGYVPPYGIIHRRRLYLTDQGHDLRGEERIICTTGLGRPVEMALRFHLHPRVQAVLIQNGREALLRLPGGAGWRFSHAGGTLALEDSIYLGQGTQPRKTQQLVLHGAVAEDYSVLKWALQREGRQP